MHAWPRVFLYEWKKAQEKYRDNYPLSFSHEGLTISLVSEPREEQDVVALFHQLNGIGVFKYLKYFSTSYNERYDGLFYYDYPEDNSVYYGKDKNFLGISQGTKLPAMSEPKVLEFKHTFDALNRDIETEIKFSRESTW